MVVRIETARMYIGCHIRLYAEYDIHLVTIGDPCRNL